MNQENGSEISSSDNFFDERIDEGEIQGSDDCPAVKQYSADELRAMSQAELVSYAVRLQQLYQQLDNDYRFMTWEFSEFQDNLTYFSRTAKLAHKLTASDLDTVASVAVNELPNYLNCDFAALYLYNKDEKTMELFRSTSPTPEQDPLASGDEASHFLAKLFFHDTEPFIVEYVDDNMLRIVDNEKQLNSRVPAEWRSILGDRCIIFPLQIREQDRLVVLGGLVVGDSKRTLEAKDAEAALIFSDLLSSSLYNARLVQQLNEMTIIDPLTQLYNRRHLLNQLHSTMLNANRYGNSMSIAIMDIDFFKKINDSYGHVCGDIILRELGMLLKRTVRSGVDTPARYGGEEFVVIMPFINVNQGLRAGDRIRSAVKNHIFSFGERRIAVTCSIGVAEYIEGESVEKFIDRADCALYKAKNSGRDMVMADVSASEVD